jgi:hypothetical protein
MTEGKGKVRREMEKEGMGEKEGRVKVRLFHENDWPL